MTDRIGSARQEACFGIGEGAPKHVEKGDPVERTPVAPVARCTAIVPVEISDPCSA